MTMSYLWNKDEVILFWRNNWGSIVFQGTCEIVNAS